MNANTLILRISVLAILFGLVPLSASVAANGALPRVTAVNGRIEVGQIITVNVDHLSDWSASHDPRRLVPYPNGRPLTGIYPEEVNLSENRLLFHLQRTPESKKEWENLLHEPVLSRPVSFSVGLEQQQPFDTVFDYDHRLRLTVIPKTWGIVFLAVVLATLVLLLLLSARTNILRAGPSLTVGTYRPYDLGRVQTAFWFLIVSTAHLCVWLTTGDFNTLSPSVLGLMGISAVTGLGPRLMGASGNDTDQPVADPKSSIHEPISAGFFTDIISDANGYSFHRFQIVLWTVLLGIIFVSYVYDNLAMPQFSGSLLALMGLSAGTYLGFELLGKKSASNDLKARKEVLR